MYKTHGIKLQMTNISTYWWVTDIFRN
jgi:hypothetical protein